MADSTEPRCASRVAVQGKLNFCPKISLEASPLQALLAQRITLMSYVVDPEGEQVALRWTVEPDGTFDNASAPATYFRCESVGSKLLRLHAVDQLGCGSSSSVEVSCVRTR